MRRIPLVVAPFLVATALASANEICTNTGVTPAQERAALHAQLSQRAEAVASGRRRSVQQPATPATSLAIANYIDTHIAEKLTRDNIAPAAIASDEEFLRRVSLDLTGIIPDAASVNAFVADKSADKRAKKVDELLASDAFVDRWTMWVGDLVQNVAAASNIRLFQQGRNAYYTYLTDSIRNRKPYDQLVRELISGRGNSWTVGAADYVVRQIQRNGPPQDTYDNLAAHSGEKFLGMPLLCLSCHSGRGHLEQVNLYLSNKTRTEFWGMAAFFSRTQTRNVRDTANPQTFSFDVSDAPNGSYRLNTTDGNKSPRAPAAGESDTVAPAYMFTGEAPRTGETYRDAYGRMLTADRQFARATVNYLWKEMFGLGLVEPVNAFDLTTLASAPTHPALLEELATDFVSRGYDLRTMLRTMTLSTAYQLSTVYTPGNWNEAWVPYFARRYPKRMMAEAVLDSVVRATGVAITIPVQGMNPVSKAMALPDPLEAARRPEGLLLTNFGRGNRDDIARSNDGAIAQALGMMNDALVVTRVRSSNANSTVAKTLAATSDPGTIVDQLFLATLSRLPTSTERQREIDFLRGGVLAQRSEDLQWVLLNSLEFLFY
jgi:Protein of unknown function (DUF1549)/Protein of unknown function (DUF1553)